MRSCREVPIIPIFFIFNTSAGNQVLIPVTSFNFSIKENPNRIFVIYYNRKTSNVEYKPQLAAGHLSSSVSHHIHRPEALDIHHV